MSFLPAKRRRGGKQAVQVRSLRNYFLVDNADQGQVGLLPESVACNLSGCDASSILAGVDDRTARAYILAGNRLFTWRLEPAELDKEMQAPTDTCLELLDRQGLPCVTTSAPAVTVLAPAGPRMPVAVVLSNGRLIWRELERGGANSEYMAQLDPEEEVTAAAWEVVAGDLLAGGGEGPQTMAFLGTSYGRVYRVGPLGGGGVRRGNAVMASGAMARPGGLSDYLPWRIRGPGPLESVRSLMVWEEPTGQEARRVMTLTGEGVHLYDASGAILLQLKLLEQLRSMCSNDSVTLVRATWLAPRVVLLAAAVGAVEGEAHLSLFLLDFREQRSTSSVRVIPLVLELAAPTAGSSSLDALLQTQLVSSRGNTRTDLLAYVIHAFDSHQEGFVSIVNFRLDDGSQSLEPDSLQIRSMAVPRGVIGEGLTAGRLLGTGMYLRTDGLILLMEPNCVMRVRYLRHARGPSAKQGAAWARDGGHGSRGRELAEKLQAAFRLHLDARPAAAQSILEAEGLFDLPDGDSDLGAGLLCAIWQDVDLEPDTAPYWAGQGPLPPQHKGSQDVAEGETFHLLIQQSLRRKLAVTERWLRFVTETGLWTKLTEAQAEALLEGAEHVAACEQICEALLPGGGHQGERKGRDMPIALRKLLREHAMPRWGEDLGPHVRARLEAAGLPPLDIFLANPSQVVGKLASLQAARKEFIRRTAQPVPQKEKVEASVAVTVVVRRALEAAINRRARLRKEYGLRPHTGGQGGWLTEPPTLQVMECEVGRLQDLKRETTKLIPTQRAAIGEEARLLGVRWLELGTLSGRWKAAGEETRKKKRLAVTCVAEYGLAREAIDMARRFAAWEVLGELEYQYRDWAPLVEDMARHQEVAAHVLNWLLECAHLEDVLEYGATSSMARAEIEKIFMSRPDQLAAARLSWIHHTHVQAFDNGAQDLLGLADEEKTLDLKRLWVDIGILSDETARNHSQSEEINLEARWALQEEQELLQAQSWLVSLIRDGQQDAKGAMKSLQEGVAIGPSQTIEALIQLVPLRGTSKEKAVELSLRAMDLIEHYGGRRQEVPRPVVRQLVEALWEALIRRDDDWNLVWCNCGTVDPGRNIEETAYATVIRRYFESPRRKEDRRHYSELLSTPTEDVLAVVVRGVLATTKYKPQYSALLTALDRTRNTLWREF